MSYDPLPNFMPLDENNADLREWIKLKTPLILEKLKNLPTEFLLSPLPPIENQGQLASSSACGFHAGMSRYFSSMRPSGAPIYVKSGPVTRETRFFIDMEAPVDWQKVENYLDSGKNPAKVESADSDS